MDGDRAAPRVPHQHRTLPLEPVQDRVDEREERLELVTLGREELGRPEARTVDRDHAVPAAREHRRHLAEGRAGRGGPERVPEEDRPAGPVAPFPQPDPRALDLDDPHDS
jgi:hypothetical protein